MFPLRIRKHDFPSDCVLATAINNSHGRNIVGRTAALQFVYYYRRDVLLAVDVCTYDAFGSRQCSRVCVYIHIIHPAPWDPRARDFERTNSACSTREIQFKAYLLVDSIFTRIDTLYYLCDFFSRKLVSILSTLTLGTFQWAIRKINSILYYFMYLLLKIIPNTMYSIKLKISIFFDCTIILHQYACKTWIDEIIGNHENTDISIECFLMLKRFVNCLIYNKYDIDCWVVTHVMLFIMSRYFRV